MKKIKCWLFGHNWKPFKTKGNWHTHKCSGCGDLWETEIFLLDDSNSLFVKVKRRK